MGVGERGVGAVFLGYRVSVLQNEKVLEMVVRGQCPQHC